MTPDTNMMKRATAAVLEEMLASGVIDDAHAGDWVAILSARVARAAIAAIREPTEAMIEACNRAAFAQGGGAIVLRPVWDAMIDAALAEGEKG